MANRVLKELADLIGLRHAVALSKRWGGRAMSVPSPDKMTERHPIALHIGLDPALILAREYGGTALQLPNEHNALRELRNAEIARRYEQGESVRALGIDFALDRRIIQRVIDDAGLRDLRLKRSVTDAPGAGKSLARHPEAQA